MAYKYSYGGQKSLFKNPAEVAGPICSQLKDTVGLTPKTLLDASRDENAPLHNEFEWDDTIAGEKYRESQASCIIRHLIIVKVEEEHKDYKDRAFVFTGKQKIGYVSLHDAMTNEKWRTNLLKAASRDMETFKAKYHRLEELQSIILEMDKFLG